MRKEEPPQFQNNNNHQVEVQEDEVEEEKFHPKKTSFKKIDIVEVNDEQKLPRSVRMDRELRNLGIIPRISNLKLASDPGPKTMKEALIGPDIKKWILKQSRKILLKNLGCPQRSTWISLNRIYQ
jgi:hypothetical protein